MIEDAPLITLRRRFARPTAAQVNAFAGIPIGYVVDAMNGSGALDAAIKAVVPERAAFHGVALPCAPGPADNLAVFAALSIAAPGDVILAATDGYRAAAVTGDLLLGMMKNGGINAFVTDGTVRDLAGIRAVGLPCFATGITANSPARNGPGSAGLGITLGGGHVEAGDIVVGDSDGVVVIPHARIDAVIAKLAEVKAMEAKLEAMVRDGLVIPEFIKPLITGSRVREVD